jgi:phosphate-selective porin
MNALKTMSSAGAVLLALALAASPVRAQTTSGDTYPDIGFSARIGADYVTETVEDGGPRQTEDVAENSALRFGMTGDLTPRISLNTSLNAAGGDLNWLELSTTARLTGNTYLVLGQTKTTSLGNMVSSRAVSFIERGVFHDALGLNRNVALMLRSNGEHWMAAGAVFGDNVNTSERGERGYSLRGIVTPVNRPGAVLHLGAWARQRERDLSFNYAFRNVLDADFDRSGTGLRVTEDTTVALEGAVIQGPLTLQAEIAQADARGAAGEGRAMRTGYLAVGWLVTGGSRAYEIEQGRLGLPDRITNPSGSLGVFEVGARYDRVDLSSRAGGGGYSVLMLGANWYATPKIKLAVTYNRLQDYDPRTDGRVDLSRLRLRAQYDF